MRALILLLVSVVVSASVPKPPILCGSDPRPAIVVESAPAIYADPDNNTDQPGRTLRADGTAVYVFADYGEVPTECELEQFTPAVEDFAPEPLRCDATGADPEFCIDPEACIDTRENMDKGIFCPGPGPGPEGAETVDKP